MIIPWFLVLREAGNFRVASSPPRRVAAVLHSVSGGNMSIVSHTAGNTLPSEESATESIALDYDRDRVQQGVRQRGI